jgi:DNA-binding MarR family transcriptional regulator
MMRKSVDKVNRLPDHPGTDTGEDVLELVHTLMHQARSLQYHALKDQPPALTHMEGKVLGFFARHPGSTQSDLVAHSGRDKAQVGRLIKGLREQGLLDGQADAEDRRNLRLQLTPRGQAIAHGIQQRSREVSAQAVAGLSPDELARLRDLLQRLKDNLSRTP